MKTNDFLYNQTKRCMQVKDRVATKFYCMIACCMLTAFFSANGQSAAGGSLDGWQRVGPGGGGSTFSPTFSLHKADHFLVRCDMTGSYFTKNGGQSYQLINLANGASCFAFDPLDSNIVYIGAAGLNRSINGGKTWQQIFPAEKDIVTREYTGDHAILKLETSDSSLYMKEAGKIGSIFADPMYKGYIYFSMGSWFFYSQNNGRTWQRSNTGNVIESMYSNSSGLKNELYLFTAAKIFVFNKRSKLIVARDIPLPMQPARSFTAGISKKTGRAIFYALHHAGNKANPWEIGHSEVWISENEGNGWQQIKDPVITNQSMGSVPSLNTIACAAYDADNAYVTANNYEERQRDGSVHYWYGALKTTNGGKRWNWVWKGGGGSAKQGIEDGQQPANLNDSWVKKAFGRELIMIFDVGVSAVNANTAVLTDWYRIMKTTNGGKTWNEVYSVQHPDSSFTSRGLDVTTSYGVHFDPFNSHHVAVSYTDIGFHHSYNNGDSWTRSVAGVPAEWVNTCYWVAFDPAIKNKLWSAWSGMHDFPRGKMTRNPQWRQSSIARGGICISTDGGRSWKPAVDGMGSDAPATSLVLDPASPAGNRTLYACVYNKGVFKSTDDGKTWQLKNNGIGANTCAFELTLAANGILYLVVSPTPVHKEGKKGREVYPGAVYRSTDGAENWTELKLREGWLFPNGMATDPLHSGRLYLACWSSIDLSDLVGGDSTPLPALGGVLRSDDNGSTWKPVFDQKQYVYDVTVDQYHPGRIYCTTFNQAAYRSDDDGITWKKLKYYNFHWGHRVVIDENDHEKIYITTYGNSVWHGIPATEIAAAFANRLHGE